MRDADAQALAAPGRPTAPACHIGRGPGLLDEHQTLGLEVERALNPGLPPLQDVRAVLLGRVVPSFSSVIRRRSKNRYRVAMPSPRPVSARAALSSASVMSG